MPRVKPDCREASVPMDSRALRATPARPVSRDLRVPRVSPVKRDRSVRRDLVGLLDKTEWPDLLVTQAESVTQVYPARLERPERLDSPALRVASVHRATVVGRARPD